MLGFLDTKISTPIGILILLLIAGTVGTMIFWQFYKLVTIRFEMVELRALEQPLLEEK